jgi:hypothetical protein
MISELSFEGRNESDKEVAMFKKVSFLWVLGFFFFPLYLFAHGDESRVEMELESASLVKAGEVRLEFQLFDLKTKTALTDKNLNVVHEKLLHMFIFDPALEEFQHVHPQYNGSSWVTENEKPILSVNGNYWVWVQGELYSDKEEFTSNVRLKVTDGKEAHALPPVLGNVREKSDKNSIAKLSPEKLRAGKMLMPTITLSRNDGSKPNLTPFLGAMVHVIATPSDGDSLIHVHPMDHGKPNEFMLHVAFPAEGEYRLWIQFVDDGVLRTVPLSVVVQR